jgi:hypothetical protein
MRVFSFGFALLGSVTLAALSQTTEAGAATQDFLLLSDCPNCLFPVGISGYATTPLGGGEYQITGAVDQIGGGAVPVTPLPKETLGSDNIIYFPSPNVFDANGIAYNIVVSGTSYNVTDTCGGTGCNLNFFNGTQYLFSESVSHAISLL